MENALQYEIGTLMSRGPLALPKTLADEIQQGRFHPFIGDSSAPEPVNVREKRSTTTPGSPQAGAASAPAASSPSATGGKGDEPRERKIFQHGQLRGTVKLTDAEAKVFADDADFKAQGGTIK